MIVFDLDGTLADCEHRRHFVNVNDKKNQMEVFNQGDISWNEYKKKWKPNWKLFFELCDQDKPIELVMGMFFKLLEEQDEEIEIWSGRCASVEEKTEKWIKHQLDWQFGFHPHFQWTYSLQMRPEGDSTPEDQLKEMWLDQAIAEDKKIKFVFDDRPKVVRMWRKRGIFVFNCCQHDEEF